MTSRNRSRYAQTQLALRFGSPIGVGKDRVVFADGDEVVKVPLHEAGEYCNERELIRDMWLGDPARYALTRTDESLTNEFGILIIRMERVTPLTNILLIYDKLPDWCGAVDCFQVGHTEDGRLVAYDWGT